MNCLPHSFFFNFLLYFIDYAVILVPTFPLCPPPLSTLHSLRQSSHLHSSPWVMHVSSLSTPFPILYLPSPWPFCNYLFIHLNPCTFSSVLQPLLHLVAIKLFSIPMILFLFCWFDQFVFQLQLLIDMYVLPLYCSQF